MFLTCGEDDFWKVCRNDPVGESAAALRPGRSKVLMTESELQS
jgi:hypothetical protein